MALPTGSFVVLTHATFDFMPPATLDALAQAVAPQTGSFRPRSQREVARFPAGLSLLSPGSCPVNQWRAHDEPRPSTEETAVYGAVARVA
jgi:hypothetical protein